MLAADVGDAWTILAAQWIGTTLNGYDGADTSAIDDLLEAGWELLDACVIDEDDRADALEIGSSLEDYNLGETGPGSCDARRPGQK
ncbi:MAG: hypothetical protein ACNA8W_17265 [Bradymonadaceae bacterium]